MSRRLGQQHELRRCSAWKMAAAIKPVAYGPHHVLEDFGCSADLAEVPHRNGLDNLGAARSQFEESFAAILGGGPAQYQVALFEPRDQAHCAVALDHQAIGKFADAHGLGPGMGADRQQRLVLLRRQAVFVRTFFAEGEKLPNGASELCERGVIAIG